MTPESTSPHGNFSAMLSTALNQKGMNLKQLSVQLGISYEQTRRLAGNESLPTPLRAEQIAEVLDIDPEELKKAAQRDRMQRKFGSQLFAEVAGATSERVENFAPLINSLLPEQVPHAMAMMSGLVSAALVKQAVLATTPEDQDRIQQGRKALQDAPLLNIGTGWGKNTAQVGASTKDAQPVLPVVKAMKKVLTAKHKRKMRGEPEAGV
jgi:transcriptional regulator with XRE-family HTH domain